MLTAFKSKFTRGENQVSDLVKLPLLSIVHGRRDFIIEQCKGKRVVHLGCVDKGLIEKRLHRGNLLHSMLSQVAPILWGVDLDERGLDIMRQSGFINLFKGDFDSDTWSHGLGNQEFDVIVATELLEHLKNPGVFLDTAKSLFGRNTIMLLSVPNGLRLTGRLCMIRGCELVNPDHNYWFSYATLNTLLHKSGYEVLDAVAYSYVNHRLSLLKVIFSGIRSALLGRSHTFGIKNAGEILLRRWCYGRNACFADGFIFTVRPFFNAC
jgi:2-polyprenyl-3-methyl-5-hydroxy-6-metoxy-1,4-benzoquinol methylase